MFEYIRMDLQKTTEDLWKNKKELHKGDIVYNYTGDNGSVKFFQILKINDENIKDETVKNKSAEDETVELNPMEVVFSLNLPREVIPGSLIEGKTYVVKNKDVLRKWCFPYPQEEPIYQYAIARKNTP